MSRKNLQREMRLGQVRLRSGQVLRHVLREGLHVRLFSPQAEQQAAEGSLHLYALVLDVFDAEHAAVHDVFVVVHQRRALDTHIDTDCQTGTRKRKSTADIHQHI